MSNPIGSTEIELRMVELLRGRCMAAIDTNGAEWAAERLDISTVGVEALQWRQCWSVGTAVHAAGCLGVLTEADLDRLDASASVAH